MDPTTKEYSWVPIVVGAMLVALAILIEWIGVDLPYKRLLIYAGVAALFSGIGANAAVKLDWKRAGQVGAAGGAAAIAILLCWTIGPDQRPEVPRLNMTYYVNFPDGKKRSPKDLTATIAVANEHQKVPRDLGSVPISRAPGGDAVKLTITGVSARDFITLKIHSAKENKNWTSASVMLTESFMNLNDGD